MISIQKEIDLMIDTANELVKYKNRRQSYEQFVDNAVAIARNSQLNTNLQWYNDTLMSWKDDHPDTIKENILDFDGLMQAIQNSAGDVDQEKYQQAKNYYQTKLNDIQFEDYE